MSLLETIAPEDPRFRVIERCELEPGDPWALWWADSDRLLRWTGSPAHWVTIDAPRMEPELRELYVYYGSQVVIPLSPLWMIRREWEVMTGDIWQAESLPELPSYTPTQRHALVNWEDRYQTQMDVWIDERFEDWHLLPLNEPIAFIHPDICRVRARVLDDQQQEHFWEFRLWEGNHG